jgi:hypothetical protein
MKNISGSFALLGSTILLVAMVLIGWFVPLGMNWLIVAALMVLFFLWLGAFMTGKPLGILINERNLMSLSRFQMVVWTILILSAYLTLVLHRTKTGVPDALVVPIDWHLWALMGISVTSLVGTPLVLSTKFDKKPADSAIKRTAAKFNEKTEDIQANRQGVLYVNSKPEEASFKDIFEGDEIKNTTHIDLAKVQMFFFTVIIACGYGIDLFAKLSGPVIFEQFPPLSEGVLALLGISHAGYLSSKGISHTETAPERVEPSEEAAERLARGMKPKTPDDGRTADI